MMIAPKRFWFFGLFVFSVAFVALVLSLIDGVVLRAEPPNGCDSFGYLRQARLFRENGIAGFNTAIQGPVVRAVIEAAKATGIPSEVWSEAITPGCHGYKAKTDQVIDQYPPGTGLIFSLFPEGKQQRWTVATSLILVCIIAIFAALGSGAVSLGAGFLAAGAVTVLAVYYEGSALSVWPSAPVMMVVALLTAIAFTPPLKKAKWWWLAVGIACGIALNIRIPNGFVAAGIAAGILFQRKPIAGIAASSAIFAVGCIVGALPTLFANWINAGSPFSSTYNPRDSAFTSIDWGLFLYILEAYQTHAWTLIACAACVVAAAGALVMRAKPPLLIAVWINIFISLAYYLSHWPANSYYVLPIAIWGIFAPLFWFLLQSPKMSVGSVTTGFVVTALLLIVASTKTIKTDPAFSRGKADVMLPANAVLWSEINSGYAVYFNLAYGARLDFAPAAVADLIIEEVRKRGLRQFVLPDAPALQLILSTRPSQRFGEIDGSAVFELTAAVTGGTVQQAPDTP